MKLGIEIIEMIICISENEYCKSAVVEHVKT